MKAFKLPKMTPNHRTWRGRILKRWPLLVWLGVIIMVMYLYSETEQFGGMIGAMEVITEPVAPLETARLISIEVTLGQRVKAGDVVARLDSNLVRAEIAVVDAQMLEAESAIARYERDILTLVQRIEIEIKNAKAALETEKLNLQRDSAELAELKKELKRLEGLLPQKLITEQEVNALRPPIAALEKATAAYPVLIEIHQSRVAEAKKQRKDLIRSLRVDENIDIAAAIRLKQEGTLGIFRATKDMNKLRLNNYTLCANRDGVVSEIFYAAGDVIPNGIPIMNLAAEYSNHVIGFLPEMHVRDVTVGQKARVWRQGAKGSGVSATVVSITPAVLALPGRLSVLQAQRLRGRRVILKIEGEHDFIPGETVQIRTGAWKWFF